jgi:hypothetical protein
MRGGAARQFLRFAIGAVLLASAAGKLPDIRGFADVLRTYKAFPDPVLFPLALAIPLGELALALWLFSGQALAAAAGTSVVVHFVYSLWSAISVLKGLRLSNCGCFGVFWPHPLGWSTVLEDLVLLAASFALATLARKRFPPPVGGARGVSPRLTSAPAATEGRASRSKRPAGRGERLA